MQDAGPGHDTSSKPALPAPRGLGLGWVFQVFPFHRSERVAPASAAEFTACWPTAVQAAAAAHPTPASAPLEPGVEVWIRCQAVPFHASASVTEVPVPLL
jgi:hypothetical protein